jgi:hypothetical protein
MNYSKYHCIYSTHKVFTPFPTVPLVMSVDLLLQDVFTAPLRNIGRRATTENTALLLRADSLPWELVCDRRLVTGLHATVR